MAERNRFFNFNWAYLTGVILFTASAWLSEGPLFVAVVGLVAAVVIGVYYATWKLLQGRST